MLYLLFQELSSPKSELSLFELVSTTRSSRKSDWNVPPHVSLHHSLPGSRELGKFPKYFASITYTLKVYLHVRFQMPISH